MDTIANSLLSGSIDTTGILQTATSGMGGLLSSFSVETIIAGVIISIIGVYYIKIGRKDGRIVMLLCGIALCFITYFVQQIRYLIGVSLLISLIPIFLKY